MSLRRAPTRRRLQLFARVMRLGRLWFGRSLAPFFLGLGPVGVKHARFIDPLVSVRAKEITLRLHEVCRKQSGAITVEVRQRGRKGRRRYAMFDRYRKHETPLGLRLL